MHAQADRAETPYLKSVYSVIAENWDRLAAEMESGTAESAGTSPRRSPIVEAGLRCGPQRQ